ncbi:hypothetical protein AHAS_Ahas02G0062500 [Arachis hypogaea]
MTKINHIHPHQKPYLLFTVLPQRIQKASITTPRLRNYRATLLHLFSKHRDAAPSGFGHRDSTEATYAQPSSLTSPAASTPCRASPTIAAPISQ